MNHKLQVTLFFGLTAMAMLGWILLGAGVLLQVGAHPAALGTGAVLGAVAGIALSYQLRKAPRRDWADEKRLCLRLTGCLGVALMGVVALLAVNVATGASWAVYFGALPGFALLCALLGGEIARERAEMIFRQKESS
jgi:uncharacterized membrane protein